MFKLKQIKRAMLPLLAIFPGTLWAQSETQVATSMELHTLWMLLASAMVLLMHMGFASLEAGLTRSKNTVNILFKNFAVLAVGVLVFGLLGFGLMYPELEEGVPRVGPGFAATALEGGWITPTSFFLFQAMFAATCATIVSGAVAERIKVSAFLIFCALYVSFVYPWLGSWTWGGGWLADKGFHDFAGSTLVHSVGGWAALAGAIVLGPRLGKYVNSTVKPIIGHNLPLATLGVFMLWFGWYGFNGGSLFRVEAGLLSHVFLVTTLSASAGVASAMLVSWMVQRKPDLTMMLNGALAGLVAITAGADVLEVKQAVFIGVIAGLLVVLCVSGFDKIHVDDPVGALSVHLVNGIWGTLAAGIFSPEISTGIQALGVLSYGAAAFASSLVIFLALKHTVGARVDEEEELGGLDLGEHGMEAYTGFQIFTSQ